MNLLDAYVKTVLSEPVYNDTYAHEGLTWWQVNVEYTCWSDKVETTRLTFKTKEEADLVIIGYKFFV
jgi:TPP-dependent trihydroxycyclohexane-1,2-dione (THcHDO) dehydratase